MIRVVLDTNTLASVSIASSGPLATLLEAWRASRVQVMMSQPILRELGSTLNKPYFARRLDSEAREEFLALARMNTTMVAIATPIPSLA